MLARVRRPATGFSMFALFVALGLGAGACGGKDKPDDGPEIDAAPPPTAQCGDGVVEGDEQCDDGNTLPDATCDAECRFSCGNGVVEEAFGEACDTGITSGTGACPTTCDDGMACTSDQLMGTACEAQCLNAPITAPVDGDGCCPAGANSLTDDDCDPACGNGVVEAGEVCDTGITAGAGACPTTCDDSQSCTTDTLSMGGTCQATCTNTPITAPANNDGCCPAGANSGNDNDCAPGCGNGVVDSGETCDTGITTGPGSCPTTCNDNMACTNNVLANAGTCTAACTFPPITTCTNGDGCCPTGCNANNDDTCQPVCGNGVVEGTEQCDDGNTNNNDQCTNACRIPVVAFRFTDLDLRDPHVHALAILCLDVTPHGALGFSVNDTLRDSLTADGDTPPDGLLDLAPTLVFRSFTQTAGATQPVEVHLADCTAPQASTMCRPSGDTVAMATATNMATGTCLSPTPGTFRTQYTPTITNATGPCFGTSGVTITLNLGGIPITLSDARVASTYSGNPAQTTINGLLMGFVSEATANTTIIPSTFPVVGGQPLSSILPGGTGNCAGHSDKDTNNGVPGWWFYLNFTAARAPWSDN